MFKGVVGVRLICGQQTGLGGRTGRGEQKNLEVVSDPYRDRRATVRGREWRGMGGEEVRGETRRESVCIAVRARSSTSNPEEPLPESREFVLLLPDRANRRL